MLQNIDLQVFKTINQIIEEDKKSSTYKFALLRATIEVIQDDSPFIKLKDGYAHLPFGAIIEKWILYYYSIFASPYNIPQQNGNRNSAFQTPLIKVISYYRDKGQLEVFFNDFSFRGFPKEIEKDFTKLARDVADTIKKQPMRYIGGSVSHEHYSIYSVSDMKIEAKLEESPRNRLLKKRGYIKIPEDFYSAFSVLGSFISGRDSILARWAQFSRSVNKDISIHQALEPLLQTPTSARDVLASERIFRTLKQQSGKIPCVWSGSELKTYDIDHIIPFSIWQNNDLWNLLPASKSINSNKSNGIPTEKQLLKSKERIISYWQNICRSDEQRFSNEVAYSLLGRNLDSNWEEPTFARLVSVSKHLIGVRGYKAWEL